MSAPGGDLTLTGTHWLVGRTGIEGLPGTWWADGTGVRVSGADGLLVDGAPTAEGLLRADQRLMVGDVELKIIRRGDDLAVRTYDPHAPAVARFAGIDAFAPDPAWVVSAEFTPAEGGRTLRTAHSHSDRLVDYPVVGTFTFTVDGRQADLVALYTGHEGEAHITFRDATSGRESYGAARFLFVPLPPTAGPVTLDFNRTTLPPCAFSDAFICPLPPPGNVLPFAVRAGEKVVC
ncbi:DUF1684 domain-containing protein [Planosporangium thailandense]|uniref:DUF1684 domain-containing protein n=1 Tax=Planosporangium thailandense TaxID=765197 RepID=A0ABX0Y9W0_9ACTN|nr:DUF1684 domain-containing protein [Planosporangium thailandense]